jgi:dUTP pyrophosphatase
MIIKAKKIHKDAIIPKHLLHGDAGLDLHSVEDVVLKPGERFAVPTGLAFEFPEGYVALIWDKSGLALKKGIKTMGGVIEHTYRGEYKIIMLNTDREDLVIKKGDKIAQMLIQPVMSVEVKEAKELSQSARGNHGFGSADEALSEALPHSI